MTVERRIASLEPYEPIPQDAALRAEISLLWPYSSSSQSSAILLVDPDYRQRHNRGQIRVRFCNAAAKALARAHVGIGDLVYLQLAGARWHKQDEKALSLTPGKAVDADLLFDQKVALTVLEDDSGGLNGKQIKVDEGSRQRPPGDVLSTPARRYGGRAFLLSTPLSGGYASPAYMRRLRLSADSFLQSPGLVDDEEQSTRKKRRISLNDSYTFATPYSTPRSRSTFHREDEEEVDSVLNAVFGISDVGIRARDDAESILSKDADQSRVEGGDASVFTRSPSMKADTTITELVGRIAKERSMPQQRPTGIDQTPTRASMLPPLLPISTLSAHVPKQQAARPTTPELRPDKAAELPLPSPFPQTPLSRTPLHVTNEASKGLQGVQHGEKPAYFDQPFTTAPFPAPGPNDVLVRPTSPLMADAIAASEAQQQVTEDDGRVESALSPSSGSEADVSSIDEEPKKLDPMETPAGKEEDIPTIVLEPRSAFGAAIYAEFGVDPPGIEDAAEAADEYPEYASFGAFSSEDEEEDGPDRFADGLELQRRSVSPDLPGQSDHSETSDTSKQQAKPVDAAPATSPSASQAHLTHVIPKRPGWHTERSFVGSDVAPESQDDTDAAFDAMDAAIVALVQDALETQQAPGPPLASVIAPPQEILVARMSPPAEAPTPAIIAQEEHGRYSYTAHEPIRGHPMNPSKIPVVEGKASPKPNYSLSELFERARQRSEEMRRNGLLNHIQHEGVSVEVVDLTKVEPVAPSHKTEEPRRDFPPSVADSAETPVTVLAEDSSRPHSRADGKDFDFTHPSLTTFAQPSQELGSTQGFRTNGNLSMLRNVHRTLQDIAEDDLDTTLLAELDVDIDTHKSVLGDKQAAAVSAQSHDDTKDVQRNNRHRLSARLSAGTDALSSWFKMDRAIPSKSDRRHTTSLASPQRPPASTAPVTRNRLKKTKNASARGGSVSPPPLKRYSSSQGLRTSLTYMTPLTNLDMHLNTPSARVDVMAIVTGSAEETRRSKSGPRDWYSVFHITDPAHLEQEEARPKSAEDADPPRSADGPAAPLSSSPRQRHDIRVEVFRPWKASLPVVREGDAVLLRNFVVRSRSRRAYLLSGDESAWCAFRPAGSLAQRDVDGHGEDGNGVGRPAWAGIGPDENLVEEVRGPPVEVGPEERQKAVELRGWWDVVTMLHNKGKKRATL